MHTRVQHALLNRQSACCVVQVFESHQASKKDTSGTAKAVVASFNKLGLQFDESQVRHMHGYTPSLTSTSSIVAEQASGCTAVPSTAWPAAVCVFTRSVQRSIKERQTQKTHKEKLCVCGCAQQMKLGTG